MKHTKDFHDVVIVVSPMVESLIVHCDDELKTMMDGPFLEDNVQIETMKEYPTEPGLYTCTLEYWFLRGTYEGMDAPGESEWDFVPKNIERVFDFNGVSCADQQAEIEYLDWLKQTGT